MSLINGITRDRMLDILNGATCTSPHDSVNFLIKVTIHKYNTHKLNKFIRSHLYL